MLFSMCAEEEFVNHIENLTQVIATLNSIFKLAKYFTYFVFNRVSTLGICFEFFKIRK